MHPLESIIIQSMSLHIDITEGPMPMATWSRNLVKGELMEANDIWTTNGGEAWERAPSLFPGNPYFGDKGYLRVRRPLPDWTKGCRINAKFPKSPQASEFTVGPMDAHQSPGHCLFGDPVHWNPENKVVQDHRDGTVHHAKTNEDRANRGLPVPWYPGIDDARDKTLERQISELINRASRENASDTPDFVLASFLMSCLEAFEQATRHRDSLRSMDVQPTEDPPADPGNFEDPRKISLPNGAAVIAPCPAAATEPPKPEPPVRFHKFVLPKWLPDFMSCPIGPRERLEPTDQCRMKLELGGSAWGPLPFFLIGKRADVAIFSKTMEFRRPLLRRDLKTTNGTVMIERIHADPANQRPERFTRTLLTGELQEMGDEAGDCDGEWYPLLSVCHGTPVQSGQVTRRTIWNTRTDDSPYGPADINFSFP